MKPVSGKRLCKALEREGWVYSHTRGSHQIYVNPEEPFNIPVPVPVHGNRDLPTGTQRAIMRDAGLTDADL